MMNEKHKIDEFEMYWLNEEGRYALLSFEGDVNTASVIDKEARCFIVIEDDNIATEVVRRMYAAGVPLLTDLGDVPQRSADGKGDK